jgi:hypothetical protein
MDPSPPPALAPAVRQAIVREWLARVLADYPEQSSRFLLGELDPFRNPVGRALRDGLPVLLDEIAGGFDLARVTSVLDEIVHIRAVQDFSASQAVGFLFLLKPVLRKQLGGAALETLERRIDELALLAFDLYVRCREKAAEIRVQEARRRVYLLERAAGWNR